MKYFIEKIQNIKLYHNDKESNLLGAAYDYSIFPNKLDLKAEVHLFNIEVEKEYVIVVQCIYSNEPSSLHILDNVLLVVKKDEMIKINNNYGLAFGGFITSLPIDEPSEIELNFELRQTSDMKILDTFKTYLTIDRRK